MKPKIHELDPQQLEAHLDEIERVLGEEIARPFRILLTWYLSLLRLIQKKSTTIGTLRQLLFGTDGKGTRPKTDSKPDSDKAISSDSDGSEKNSEPPEDDGKKPPRRKPGHGRNPAEAYSGCERVFVSHESFKPGDSCPHCAEGTLYRFGEPTQVVRLKGQPPVGGTRYELERLRCGLCGKIEKAELPAEAGTTKYDATVTSIVATLRYGQGMPWKRIEQIQRSAGIPLPASVQWELVHDATAHGVGAAYGHLLQVAAQGELIHNDDTSVRILELTTKLKKQIPLREDDPTRYGVFTTSILSIAEGRPDIALFFTGPRHSGENLRELLARRVAGLPRPLQMCDALSRNIPQDLETVVIHCLSHGRRYFKEVEDFFPDQVRRVLKALSFVYRVDREAKMRHLSPEDRLRLHQEWSRPVMDALHRWLEQQFEERRVEPNSSLGEAISYLLKYWDKLTMFLRISGAPLDNNLCERALKMAIRHRRNSLFYKTMRGAKVGDLYMSLIHTCFFAHVDPHHYLTELQRNAEAVQRSPESWMPWNYHQQLTATDGQAVA